MNIHFSRPQFSDDDSMEWEAIIEPINIVNEVSKKKIGCYIFTLLFIHFKIVLNIQLVIKG